MNIVIKRCVRCNTEITEANCRSYKSRKGELRKYSKCRPCIRELDKIYWQKPENKARKVAYDKTRPKRKTKSRSFGTKLIHALTEAVHENNG